MITRRDFLWMTGLGATTALINWQFPAQAAISKVGPGGYDAVIIGAGLGGLSCAAYLAVNGFRPLVIEKHYLPGGYATAFTRSGKDGQPYRCEVSLHATAAYAPPMQKLFKDLELLDKLTFVPHKYVWNSLFPNFAMDIPGGGLDRFRDLLTEISPNQKKGLTDFFAYWQNLEQDMERFDMEGMPAMKVLFPLRYPTMWDIRNKTLAEVVDRYITDRKLKTLICQTWGYYGLPAARLSAFYYLHPFGEYLKTGGYYLKGTSQTLSAALVDTIKRHGGEIILNDRVTEIRVDGETVKGVKTASGKAFSARAVVSNIDVPETLAILSRPDAVPASYHSRIASLSASLSSFIVWLGLNREVTSIESRTEINIYAGYDDEAAFRGSLKGNPSQAGVTCMIYDNLVKDFSPPGKSTLSIMFLCGYEPWKRFEKDYLAGNKGDYRREKERIADQLIAIVEKSVIPGLSKMIDMREAATPLTNRRFTGNKAGAIYGYDQTVNNAFMNRLENKTPISGLYLASAWSNPGGGYEGTLLGGKGAFKALVEDWR
ncbi:MAG: 4,4'-diapolycopene oxygenase [Syntrophus sp. SKADARSKE-3]|nr:4,4'-diapolycopene oxygenase [Syntrophus sp. SKADARSKE-3]